MRLVDVVGSGEELRQGDIVGWVSGPSWPFGTTLAFVLTADCDLAQGKHYGQVLLCPIASAETYFRHLWCQKKAEALEKKALERILKIFADLEARGLISSVSPSVVQTISENEVVMGSAIGGVDGVAQGTITELLKLSGIRRCLSTTDADWVHRCREALVVKDGKSCDLAHGSLISDFKVEVGQDAQDVVVIPDDMAGDGLLHVLLLRFPFSVPLASVGLIPSAGAAIKRVGKFVPDVKYLVAQRFGTLFSRVGMKRMIEEERKASLDMLEIPL